MRTTLIAYLVAGMIGAVLLAPAWPLAPELLPLVFRGGVLLALYPVGAFLSFSLLSWVNKLECARCRARMLEHHPQIADDPRSAAITQAWEHDRDVDYRRLSAALHRISSPGAGLLIVCLGEVDVPDVEDVPQEPMVITPSRSAFGSFCGVMSVLLSGHLLLCLLFLSGLSAPIVLDAVLLVLASTAWFWTVMLRPRYVRVAPGAIQILRYWPFSNRPRINELPLAGGTHVFLRRGRTTDRLGWLAVCRGDRCERIDLTGLNPPERSALWRAFLSTAPPPPLSKESLSG